MDKNVNKNAMLNVRINQNKNKNGITHRILVFFHRAISITLNTI